MSRRSKLMMDAALKRRPSGRRQVLSIEEPTHLSRKPWQAKYEQICADHRNKFQMSLKSEKTVPEKSSPKKDEAIVNNPLSGLLAQYTSDSESDEGDNNPETTPVSTSAPPKKKLTDEVSDFLQEIQTIAPENAVATTETEPPSNYYANYEADVQPSVGDNSHYYEEQGHYIDVSGCAWQECYDDSSGYTYYWNMETNDVTWEMPPEYHAYMVHQQQWMEQTQAAMMYQGYAMAPMPKPAVIEAPAIINHPGMDAKKVGAHQRKRTVTKKTGRSKSQDSDDEKIELITSYGPASDEECEEASVPKKKKMQNEKAAIVSAKTAISVPEGPEDLPLRPKKKSKKRNVSVTKHPQSIAAFISNLRNDEQQLADNGGFGGSSLLSDDFPDMGPPGEEENISPYLSNLLPEKVESKVTQSEEELSSKEPVSDSVCNAQVPLSETKSDTTTAESSPVPAKTETANESDKDELLILSHLRNRAQLLKKLGGKVPEEVSDLLEDEETTDKQTVEKESTENGGKCDDKEEKGATLETSVHPEITGSPKTNSFALIAGYGDDSDLEEEKKDITSSRKSSKKSSQAKPSVLFPSMSSSVPGVISSKDNSVDVSSETVGVHKNSIGDSESSNSKNNILQKQYVDTSVLKTNSEEETNRISQSVPSPCEQVCSSTNAVSSGSEVSATSSVTPYHSGFAEGGRRGLGFSVEEHTLEKSKLLNSSSESGKASPTPGKMINFVKAETLNLLATTQYDTEASTEAKAEQQITEQTENVETAETDELSEMAEVIMEKVSFLAEGKEPISAVQMIGIQVETLGTAWHHGSLCENYFSHWLSKTVAELARLEQDAAPAGWQCLWSRPWRRYYYYNKESGEVQWEFPTTGTVESLPAVPTSKDATEDPAQVPQQPIISDYISDSEEKSSEVKKKKKKSQKKSNLNSTIGKSEVTANQVLTCRPEEPPLPPEQVPFQLDPSSDNPPLPANSPPPPSPPPPLPSSPDPPLPHRKRTDGTQPLPPGVDPPELPYVVAGPPLPMPDHLDTTDIDGEEMLDSDIPTALVPIPLSAQYADSGVFMMSHPSVMGVGGHLHTTMDYGPVAYSEPVVATSHVIAKPPAKASLHSEINSFYSDLASLEKKGAIPPAAEEISTELPQANTTSEVEMEVAATSTTQASSVSTVANIADQKGALPETECKTSEQSVADGRKKKKTKLVPGLALKKKGVSNLVAKWQKVQKEVRRDLKSAEPSAEFSDK